MPNCEFQYTDKPGLLRCPFCRTFAKSDDPPTRTHRKCMASEPIDIRFGLGDLVAWLLGRAGVKKKRGCGCRRRQAALNRVWNVQTMVRRWRAVKKRLSRQRE